jgi:hypothetical protein
MNFFQFRQPLKALAVAMLAAGAVGSGCGLWPHGNWMTGDVVTGQPYQPSNVYGQTWPLGPNLRRVAVLPLITTRTGSNCGQEALGPVLLDELGQAKVFDLAPVSPEQLEAWTGRKAWSASEPLPRELVPVLQEKLSCDGVLFAELTRFQPYPPLVVGWNLKLVDLRSGEILWAVDEVFDAGQPAVANGARRYQMKHSQLPGSLSDSRFILLAPTAFGHYSVEAILSTLPPRHSS